MMKLTKEEQHRQCIKEIKATLLVVFMPAWFVVSVLGTVVLAVIGVFWLLKFVFVDFQYEEDESEGENEQ